jgi:hypothetical protein
LNLRLFSCESRMFRRWFLRWLQNFWCCFFDRGPFRREHDRQGRRNDRRVRVLRDVGYAGNIPLVLDYRFGLSFRVTRRCFNRGRCGHDHPLFRRFLWRDIRRVQLRDW